MGSELKKISIKLRKEQYEVLENIMKKEDTSMSDVIRNLIDKALDENWMQKNEDKMAKIVRSQMEVVIKPHIERLAALSSKGGHMAATAAFLNVQAFMDLVPNEKKKDVKELYDKARKKSVEYMRTRTED